MAKATAVTVHIHVNEDTPIKEHYLMQRPDGSKVYTLDIGGHSIFISDVEKAQQLMYEAARIYKALEEHERYGDWEVGDDG